MLNRQESHTSPTAVHSIAFVDQSLSDYESLIQGIQVDKVVLLNGQTHGIDQITETLEKYQNLDSVHIFSHGSDNTLQLGNGYLSETNLNEYQADLQNWQDALSADADLLFYGCNLAADGDQFVQELAQLTQADVAASNDLTGHSGLGGDWDLEVTTGNIESGIALRLATQESYKGQLNLTFENSRYELGTAGLTWEQAKAEAEAKGGKIVEINSAAENEFIFNNFGGNQNPIWLGFNDTVNEGSFVDSDGTPLDYSNWLPGEPDNYNNQDYATMASVTGQWGDTQNTGGDFFNGGWSGGTNQLVIEYEQPASLPLNLTFENSRYELGTAGLTWEQAKAEAEAKGGKIVEINSAAENAFIFNNFGGNQNSIWLGFNDKVNEGSFVGSDGTPLNYSNWIPGEPNNDGNQDYAVMASSTGQWDDATNVGGYFYTGIWSYGSTPQLVIEYEQPGSVPPNGADLIVNGSFEGLGVNRYGWNLLDASRIEGWNSLNGNLIEVWGDRFGGVQSSEGVSYIELDNGWGAIDGLYQDVQTEAGRVYQLTFDMRARGNNLVSDDEAVVVEWNGQNTKLDGYHATTSGEWTTITVLVEGTGGLDRLTFRESSTPGASDTSGPFLDNISLKAVGTEFTSSSIAHGSNGQVALGGQTWYFQNVNADGQYVYSQSQLEDDNALSYELSDSDVDFLVKQAKLGVVAASDLADISDARGIRELDGLGNNVRNPLWGNADQTYARIVEARYQNDVDELRQGPNPRDISNIIFNQNRDGITDLFGPNAGDQDLDRPNGFRGSEFVSAFGQYFDHGLGFLPKGGTNNDGTSAGTITDLGNSGLSLSLTRGSVENGTGISSTAREHPNQTSPFIDQNQAYGSNDAILEFLLERDNNGRFTGRLLAGPDGGLPNLAEAKANWKKGVDAGLAEQIDFNNPETIRNFRGSGDPLIIDINRGIDLDLHLIAGDGRVNENAGLSVVHEIWHNNHNFWVEKLLTYFDQNGGVPADVTSEHIFQMAKIINEGEYQRAVFDEFVELMVGSDVHSFRDYNPNINADLTHEFAAAAYRLGHSMLNNYITVRVDGADNVNFSKNDTVEVPLFDLFLNPTKFRELGAADIMAGMTTSLHQEIDTKIVTTLRNNLTGRPSDLASFNIARGRDVGLPTLNDMREAVGLPRYSSWNSFASNLRNSSDLAKFQQIYNSVDEIDLWVGGLAEKASSSIGFGTELAQNSVMGETFAQVFSIQMIALQDGDRFYYKHRLFETNLRQNMQSQDFADIVERTLGLEYLQADILQTVDNRLDFRSVDQTQLQLNGTSGHDVIIARNIGETINGKAGDDTIFAKAGNDVVNGEDGDDALHGGSGDDELVGGSGDDRADGGTGNDTILAGDGDDDISGNEGNDYMDGGADDDELFGGEGEDTLLGSDGNDNVWGGLGDDTVQGGSGRDNLSGNEGNDLLEGGSGQDVIIGGAGNDTLTGGSEADEFWFLPESGEDVIKDFNVSQDRIDLHRYVWEYGNGRVNASTLQESAQDTPEGVRLFLPGKSGDRANSILVEGVSRSTLFANASAVFIFQDRVFERDNLILTDDNIVLDAGSGQPPSSFSLEAEHLNKTGFTNFETGVTSLRYASSGSLSYTYNGSLGLFDLDVLTFDESDGVSQLEILVNGEVVKTHLLDQNLGSAGYGPSNQVTVTAETLLLKQGDLIQVRAVRNGSEYVRIDKLNFRSLF